MTELNPYAPLFYRGRFAPSPTGPLHFGSLVTALGSYLDARNRGGEWLVRMEDLDRTREVKGAADQILRTLEGFGFEWDGEVIYQSRRTAAYAEAVESLLSLDLIYPCGCTRKEINRLARMGVEGPIYPGTCRSGLEPGLKPRSLRLRTRDQELTLTDQVQGEIRQNPAREIGDFVIRRADGYYAYQLAVVVDDAWQGITHIVRGADLLLSTPRQQFLQSLLGLSPTIYAHLPLAVDKEGRKLSKQYRAAPVELQYPVRSLLQAWLFLGQIPPAESPANLGEFWPWARQNWRLDRVPGVLSLHL